MQTLRNVLGSPEFQVPIRNGTKALNTFEGQLRNWTLLGISEEKLRNGTIEDCVDEDLSISNNGLITPLYGEKLLRVDSVNHCLKALEYAPRGPLEIRAVELEKQLAQVRLSLQRTKMKIFKHFEI